MSKSRWLTWTPGASKFLKPPETEVPKVPKMISGTFGTPHPGPFQNLETPSDASRPDYAEPKPAALSPPVPKSGVAPPNDVASWLTNSCLGVSRTSTAALALYRDYSTGAGEAGMDYPSFVRELERRGYRLHDGMITGLMLTADFIPLVQAEQVKEPAAIKEQADESSQKVRLCLGLCRRLMVHHWVDDRWICEQCGSPNLLRIYAKYRPRGRSIL